MKNLIEKIPAILPGVRLVGSDQERVPVLTYTCIKESDGTTRDQYELGKFVGIVQQLFDMHKFRVTFDWLTWCSLRMPKVT